MRRHFSIEPKTSNEGAVRKLAKAMPMTMPTWEQTPTEPRMPIGEISVMYEPATICATPATTPTDMRPSTSIHHVCEGETRSGDLRASEQSRWSKGAVRNPEDKGSRAADAPCRSTCTPS